MGCPPVRPAWCPKILLACPSVTGSGPITCSADDATLVAGSGQCAATADALNAALQEFSGPVRSANYRQQQCRRATITTTAANCRRRRPARVTMRILC